MLRSVPNCIRQAMRPFYGNKLSGTPQLKTARLPKPVTFPRNISVSSKRLAKMWNHDWITEEAEAIIARAYARHRALLDRGDIKTPPPPKEDLEKLGQIAHYKPQTIGDYIALALVRVLEPFTHLFFRDKYNHHAVVLETVAAVPGIVGGMFRHLRSLRKMQRDNGWINHLLEESENERMHLLTWMKTTQPTSIERFLVISAQGFYVAAYIIIYGLFPSVAHRFVGYLEEAAVSAYTEYLKAIDSGKLPNLPAPEIAKKYWNLNEDATIRDVILYVRADECMHRNMNHMFSDMIQQGKKDDMPICTLA